MIVALANEVVDAGGVAELAAGRPAEVFVVAPALNTPVRHWCSDDRRARTEAQHRLDRSVERLREAGLEADGWVGDPHPVTALADALAVHRADHLVVATAPDEHANWLACGLTERIRARFEIELTEFVVDSGRRGQAGPGGRWRRARPLSSAARATASATAGATARLNTLGTM